MDREEEIRAYFKPYCSRVVISSLLDTIKVRASFSDVDLIIDFDPQQVGKCLVGKLQNSVYTLETIDEADLPAYLVRFI